MSQKVLNKVNNDIFSYDTDGGVFKMSRVMPTEIHHVTAGAGTSGYMLTSTGNGWTWTDPSTLGGGGTSLTSGTGVSITNDIISIGQSVGTTDNVTFNSIDANVSKTSNLSISSTAQVNVSATQYIGLVSQNNLDLTSNSGSVGIYVSSGNFDIYAQNIRFRDGAGTVLASDISFTNWDTAYSWGDHSVAGYFNNVSISAPVSNQFLTYDGTNWINVNPDTDDILEGPGNLYYTDERVDTRIALASLGDLSNVKATSPNVGEILSYNGTNWVRDGTIKSLTGTLDGTSYDYINVTTPQHVKASWTYTTQLELTSRDAGLLVDGGLLIKASNTPAPILDGTPLEMDFMVEGNSMLIGNTYIGPNGKLTLYSDILNNNGDVIITAGGDLASVNITLKDTIAESNGDYLYSNGILRINKDLNVSNEDGTYTNGISNGDGTYSSGSDGDVLISQGFGRPPKWIQLQSGTAYIQGEGIHINNANEINVESLYFDNWNTAYSWGDHSVAGYLNNVSISAPVSNQFLTYDGTNWINVNPDTDDIVEGPGNLYYTDERVDTRIALASLGDLSNVKATSPIVGEILSYNGTNWVRDGTIKSLTGTLDGTSYDYINVTNPQHVKAGWSYSTSLDITGKHAGMVLDGGLFISSKAPITDSSGNKQVLGAIGAQFGGTPTDLEVDFMVEGTSLLIGDTFIGPNGNLVLFGDILSNSGQTILGSGGIVFESDLSVWNEGSDPKTYSSGLDGEVLVSQGQGRPPKWTNDLISISLNTDTISEKTTDTGITLTSVVKMTGIQPDYSETAHKLCYNPETGEVTHKEDGGGGQTISKGMVVQYIHNDYKKQIADTGGTNWRPPDANLNTGFVVHIKPVSALSKILVKCNAHVGIAQSQDARWWGARLYKKVGAGDWAHVSDADNSQTGTTANGTPVWFSDNMGAISVNDPNELITNCSGKYLDTADSTEDIYYTIYWKSRLASDPGVSDLFLNRQANNGDAFRPLPISSWSAIEIWDEGDTFGGTSSSGTGGGLAAPNTASTGFILPSSNLTNYDFRTYTLSGTNDVIDSDGNVIFTSVGSGTIEVSTADGVLTSATNQYISKSGALPSIPSGNFSIEFYMRFHTTPSDYHWNIVYTNNSGVKIVQYLRANGHFYFEIHPSSNFAASRIMYYDPFNENWDTVNFNHFVFIYDGTGKFYHNGTLITGSIQTGFENSVVLGSNVSFDTLYLGGGGYASRSSFGDKLDETTKFHRMYDGALTVEQVEFLYENKDNLVGTVPLGDVTNYVLASNNADGTETKWLPLASAAGGVPAPVVSAVVTTGITLPGDNLLDHDFRNYSESGGNVIDADGNVIAAIIGGGTTFTSSEGLVTSTSNYIEITDPLPALGSTGNFSIEFYARMNDPTSAWHAYFSARNDSTDSYIQMIIKGDDAWLLEMYHNSTFRQATYRPFPVGAWDSTNFHHFILTFGGTTTEKLYMDGVEVTKLSNAYNSSITYDPYESFQRLQIAGSQSYDSNIETTKYFRLYNGVLTTDEIDTLYTNRDETVGPTETVVTDVTNYALTSNNADGTETKWLSVVPTPAYTPSTTTGPTLPDGNLLDLDFRIATLSGTNVEIDGTVIGTTVGTGVTLTAEDGISSNSNSYIVLNTQMSWTINFSIELYFKLTGGNYNTIIGAWNNSSPDSHVWVARRGDGGPNFRTGSASDGYNSGNNLYSESSLAGWNGTYGHVIFTHNSSLATADQKRMYINGVDMTHLVTVYGSGNPFNPGIRDNFWIGRQNTGWGNNDDGVENLRILRVFDHVLTQDEVDTLYTNRDETYGQTETVTDVTNYALASNNADGTETKWLSVVPAPLSTSSGPALLDGNIESIDFTKATISGTNVEIDGTVIGTTVGTGVEVSETGGISTTEASYVDLNMSTGFAWTSNFTLEFYFKMPSGSVDSQQYNGLFASFNGTAGSAFGDYLVVERRDTGDGIHFYTTPANRNDGYNTLYTDSTVSGFDGTWGHLVLTNDSSQPTHLQKQMYVNGVLFTTGVLNVGSQVNFAAGTRDHYWVGRNGFGTLYENGVENLKIFRVYNRILTAQEAATLYENRDGASGSSDVTNYHLVSNNATGTVTKWEPMNSGSSRPYANLINTNGVHINLISGYTDLPFTSAILSSGIYLDSGGYLFTVNNSGVYICNVSFRLGDPDAWTSMHIRDSNNIIIATSHAIGTTNSIEAGFFFMAELNQGTSYKFTVYRNGAGATLLANAGDGYQINCLINHV